MKSYKPFLAIFLFLMMFSIASVSAWTSDSFIPDNSKSIEKEKKML